MIRLVEEIGLALILGLGLAKIALAQWATLKRQKRDQDIAEATDADHLHETAHR